MKKKKLGAPVTTSEMALLQILWDASRPLNKQEIMEKVQEDPENPLFAKNSFHLLVNELIEKGYLASMDNMGIGRKNARRYAPAVSRNEFLALQVANTQSYQPSDIPEIIAALVEFSPDTDTDAVMNSIEQMIHKRRELAKKENAVE